MILRKNQVGWLLLLLPALSSAAAIGATDEDTNLNLRGGAAKAGSVAAGKVDVADSVKPAEDGRPQWGPFVSDKDKPKKMSPGIVDIGSKGTPKSSSDSLSDSVMGDQKDLSSEFAAKDSVMDDPDHVGPKKGTTGTEGGVSEKNKKHKALEKELGGKVEKVPVSPDEARPMSTEEQERLGVEVVDDEDATSTSESKAKGAAGIQVSHLRAGFKDNTGRILTFSPRSQQISPTLHTAMVVPQILSFRQCPKTTVLDRNKNSLQNSAQVARNLKKKPSFTPAIRSCFPSP